MALESDKEARLNKFINDNEDYSIGRHLQIEYRGKLLHRQIYRLPIDLLTYNLENGRFAADKLEEEAKLGRKLVADNEEDAEKIRDLLLEKDSDETKRLKEDPMRIGQKDAGIITVAGNVINGNRRMAILSKLREETGDEKYGYLLVAILPKGADSKDIWVVESRLQFGQDFKAKYGPINVSLKIRDAVQKNKMEKEEIANALSMDVEKVEGFLKRLELIERYLEHIGRPKEYTYIEKKGGDKKGIYEHFINTQNNLDGSQNDFPNIEEQLKFMNLHFESINANSPHLFIRKLKCFRKHEDLKEKAFSKLDELKEKKIGLEDFYSEIKDFVNLAEERANTDPKRLLQIVHSRLHEFNQRVTKLDPAQRNIFNFIEGLVKEIKGKL